MESLELSITSVEYGIKNNRPEIHIWGRDKDGVRHEVLDSSLNPYLYVKDKDLGRLPFLYNIGGRVRGFKHLQTGEAMTKIYFQKPKDIGISREILHNLGIKTFESQPSLGIETFESDVLFPDVYMKEKDIFGGIIRKDVLIKPSSFYYPPRILYIDIETIARDINIMPIARRDPITVIGYKDSYHPDKIVQLQNMVPTSISFEREMLQKFIADFIKIDPDVIIGHYITGFDLPYIFDRAKVLKLKLNAMSPMGVVRKREGEVEILGREIFDTTLAYRIFRLRELEEEAPRALDKICKKELGKGQLKFEGTFEEAWNKNKKAVLDRNRRDIELVSELDQKLGLFRHFDELRRTTGIRLRDVFKKSKTNDLLLLRHASKKKYVLSNRRKGKKTEDPIGAYVGEPIPSILENVVVLDYRGFYPTIIVLFNISPETWNPLYGDSRIDESHAFNSTPKGIVPESLEVLMIEREAIKTLIKEKKKRGEDIEILEAKSEALKSNINAIYGNMGMPSSRIYHPKAAESTSLKGQQYIFKLNEMLREYGYDPFYNDTDASYTILSPEKTREMLEKHLEEINSRLPEGLEVEFQKLFVNFLIIKKKRYAGQEADGTLKIRGLEAIRTDTPELFSQLQRWVIEKIFTKAPKKEIVSRIRRTAKSIKAGRIPWYLVGTPKGVTKPIGEYKGIIKKSGIPFHIQAIITSKDLLGLKFGMGSKPRILRMKTSKRIKYPKWLAIAEETKLSKELQEKIDRDGIIKNLRSVLEKILILYKIEWTDIVPKEQKTMEVFK